MCELLKYKKLLGLFLFFVLFIGQAGATEVPFDVIWNPSQFLDCVKFEIAGLCVKGHPPRVGLKIKVWRPELLVETVKNPGESVVPFVGETVSSIAQQSLKSLIGTTITSGSQETTQAKLQFNEVHVYDFPLKNLLGLFYGGLWCMGSFSDWGALGFFKYFSELDFMEWRFGTMESIIHLPKIITNIACVSPVNPPTCMRYWGPIYPRTGFLTHQSEVVGSAGDVFRAVSNASLISFNHVKIFPLTWSAGRDDKVMMLFPKPSGCLTIGTNPLSWEGGRTSPTGEYLWMYWRRVSCCIL